MAKKTIGIYKITSPTNNVYIGQSVHIEHRISSYKRLKCKSQVLLYRSLLKHGVENHVFEIIEECLVEELNNKERYYQDLFDCIGNKGLNCKLTKSNDKSGYYSKETREKIASSNTGKIHSEETRKKLSLALKGRAIPKEIIQKRIITQTGMKRSEDAKKSNSLTQETKDGYFQLSDAEELRSPKSWTKKCIIM